MSAPAQKARSPLPVMSTARTRSSARAYSKKARARSGFIEPPSVFMRPGRVSVTMATFSRRSYSTLASAAGDAVIGVVPSCLGSGRWHMGYGPRAEADHVGHAPACARVLAALGGAAQLPGDFDDLPDACRPERVTHAEQSARGVDRAAPSYLRVAAFEVGRAFAGCAQANGFAVEQFFHREGVMQFEQIELRGRDAGLFERRLGAAAHQFDRAGAMAGGARCAALGMLMTLAALGGLMTLAALGTLMALAALGVLMTLAVGARGAHAHAAFSLQAQAPERMARDQQHRRCAFAARAALRHRQVAHHLGGGQQLLQRARLSPLRLPVSPLPSPVFLP